MSVERHPEAFRRSDAKVIGPALRVGGGEGPSAALYLLINRLRKVYFVDPPCIRPFGAANAAAQIGNAGSGTLSPKTPCRGIPIMSHK